MSIGYTKYFLGNLPKHFSHIKALPNIDCKRISFSFRDPGLFHFAWCKLPRQWVWIVNMKRGLEHSSLPSSYQPVQAPEENGRFALKKKINGCEFTQYSNKIQALPCEISDTHTPQLCSPSEAPSARSQPLHRPCPLHLRSPGCGPPPQPAPIMCPSWPIRDETRRDGTSRSTDIIITVITVNSYNDKIK